MRDEFGERRGSGTTGRSGLGGLGAERGRMASGVHVRSMADVQGTLEAHQARMREQHQRDVDKLQVMMNWDVNTPERESHRVTAAVCVSSYSDYICVLKLVPHAAGRDTPYRVGQLLAVQH